jgi:hypothetical protein
MGRLLDGEDPCGTSDGQPFGEATTGAALPEWTPLGAAPRRRPSKGLTRRTVEPEPERFPPPLHALARRDEAPDAAEARRLAAVLNPPASLSEG